MINLKIIDDPEMKNQLKYKKGTKSDRLNLGDRDVIVKSGFFKHKGNEWILNI